MDTRTIGLWAMRVAVGGAFVVMGALPKLQGDPMSREVFERVGLGPAEAMMYATGVAELAAGLLILVPLPAVSLTGALLALGVMGGAVFSHLFTPLGVWPEFTDAATGETVAPPLFIFAIGLFALSAGAAYLNMALCRACKLRRGGQAGDGVAEA